MTINVKPPAVARPQAVRDDGLGARQESQYHEPLSPATTRALLEIRHARLRLALAENELAWVHISVAAGFMPPDTGIAILNETMDRFAGGAP